MDQPQPFDKACGFSDEFFKSLLGILRPRVLEHFNLVKLMSPNHAPLIRPIRTGFTAVTRCEGKVFFRQLGFLQNLIGMNVRQSRLRGGQNKLEFLAAAAKLKYIVFKFGELSAHISAFII